MALGSVTLDTLTLIKHKDTDSPFAIDNDANDNWREIEEWSVQVKQAIEEVETGMGSITPEKIKEMIIELMRDTKRTYTIPRTMVSGEIIQLPDGVALTRQNNEYIFTIEGAEKYFVSVTGIVDNTEVHPSVSKTATEIKLYFDTQITADMRVLLF